MLENAVLSLFKCFIKY